MNYLRIMIDKKYSSTVYVADFTNYNSQNAHAKAEHSGVYISETPSDIIGSFELSNPRSLDFRAVNFEENKALFKDSFKTITQCECLFEALRHDHGKKHWAMLLELKYCLGKNVYTHVRDALVQIRNTYIYLCDVKGVLNPNDLNLYWVISTPEAECEYDFIDGAFFDQDELIDIRMKYSASLFYTNVVEVQTSSHLRPLIY